MGRLSKRTIQCRAARKARDLLKQQAAALKHQGDATGCCVAGRLPSGAPSIELLRKLGLASLQRYQQAFNIDLEAESASREELIWAIAHHFSTSEVDDESAVLIRFVHALRRDCSSESSS